MWKPVTVRIAKSDIILLIVENRIWESASPLEYRRECKLFWQGDTTPSEYAVRDVCRQIGVLILPNYGGPKIAVIAIKVV